MQTKLQKYTQQQPWTEIEALFSAFAKDYLDLKLQARLNPCSLLLLAFNQNRLKRSYPVNLITWYL